MMSCSVLVRMRIISDNSCRENQNTHFSFNNCFSENLAVCEIMWEDMVQQDTPQMAVRRMCFVCWITKATHTQTLCNTY